MDNNNFYNWEEPGKDENTQPDNVPVETGKPIYTERVKKKGTCLKVHLLRIGWRRTGQPALNGDLVGIRQNASRWTAAGQLLLQ